MANTLKESDEHREWRENFEQRRRRFALVERLAEAQVLAHPTLAVKEAMERAWDLARALESAYPWPGDEPPFSDEPELSEESPVDEASPVYVAPPVGFSAAGQPGQAGGRGFWPMNPRANT